MFDPPSLPAAGWYADPNVPNAERWWNGREWEPEWRSTAFSADAGGLPDVGEWLRRAFRRAVLRWRAVALVSLLTGAPATILFAIATRRLVSGVVITDDEIIGWSNDRLPVAVVVVVIGGLLSAIGALATAALMLRTVDDVPTAGRSATTTISADVHRAVRSIGVGVRALPRAVGWMLVFTVAIAFVALLIAGAFVVAWPIGLLLTLAAIPAVVWAAIRVAFVFQALVDRPGNPFARSAHVSSRRWWAVFGRLLLIGAITWGISMVVNIAGSLLNGRGPGGAFGGSQIEFDESGRLVQPIELTELVPVSTSSIVVSVIGALVLNICVASVSGAAFGELYRTRNPAH